MRILHFSDPHFQIPLKNVPIKSLFGKRMIGAFNLLRGRAARFSEADEKIKAFGKFQQENSIDLLICTGDFSSLGLEKELKNAYNLIKPLIKDKQSFLTVPGNHDIYAKDTTRGKFFSKYFGDFIKTDMPQFRSKKNPWPYVRFFGEDLVVIGLNSARPNPEPWLSSGKISLFQLEMLKKILSDEKVNSRFVIILTHYAIKRKDGRFDTKTHGLSNAKEFIEICKGIKNGAILNGHIHDCYRVKIEGLSVSQYCAGSLTQKGRESFIMYELKEGVFKAFRGVYEKREYKIVGEL
jgi:3',5'-cyclic AMP phosphodiesterase CpdA